MTLLSRTVPCKQRHATKQKKFTVCRSRTTKRPETVQNLKGTVFVTFKTIDEADQVDRSSITTTLKKLFHGPSL